MRRSTFNVGIVVVIMLVCGWLLFGDSVEQYFDELAMHKAESLVEQLMK